MLPSLVLDEVFLFLDRDTLLGVRGVCREFNSLALAQLLRYHPAGDFRSQGYQDFIRRTGRFVRLLEIDGERFKCFKRAQFSLVAVFPNLRFVALHWEGFSTQAEIDAFGEECLGLKGLRKVTVHQETYKNRFSISESGEGWPTHSVWLHFLSKSWTYIIYGTTPMNSCASTLRLSSAARGVS